MILKDLVGKKRLSIKNLLWMMRQYVALDPFCKEIFRAFVITGQMPEDWHELIIYSHAKHVGKKETEAEHEK